MKQMISGDFLVKNAFLDGLGLLPLCVPENDAARSTFIRHCYLTLTPEALVSHFTTALHYKETSPPLTDEQHAREFGQVLAPLLANSVHANLYKPYETAERLLLKSLAKRSPERPQVDLFYVGKALEFLRTGSGISLVDAAKRTGAPIEQIEFGAIAVSPERVTEILQSYGMPNLTPGELTNLGKDVWERMGRNTSSVERVPQNAYQAVKIHCFNHGWSPHQLAARLPRRYSDNWNIERRILAMRSAWTEPRKETRTTQRHDSERQSILQGTMSVCGYENAEAFLADGVVLSKKLTSGNVIDAINALTDSDEGTSYRLQKALGPQRFEIVRQGRNVLSTDQVFAVLKATGYTTLSDLIDAAKTLPPPSQPPGRSRPEGQRER